MICIVSPVYPGLARVIVHAAYDPSDMASKSDSLGHALFVGIMEITHASHTHTFDSRLPLNQ